MNSNSNTPDMIDMVIAFVRRNLPRDGAHGWEHRFITAYQHGCELLAALGIAEETDRGARPLACPRRPPVLPRWDDTCTTFLRLGEQQDLLSYLTTAGAGGEAPARAEWLGRPNSDPLPPPTILPGHGLGAAYAARPLMPVLQIMGLIEDGRWTPAAEQVLWREQPEEWGLNIGSDPRLLAAADHAAATMPDHVRSELQRLAIITNDEIADRTAWSAARIQELSAQFSPGRVIYQPLTPDAGMAALRFLRRHAMDQLFEQGWRMSEGWLTDDQQECALDIFHDPLATMMRREVMRQLRPDSQWAAE